MKPTSPLLEKFGYRYPSGSIIFCEHEPGETCFVISSGEVAIVKIGEGVEKTLAVLGPGEIFGEMSVLEKKPRTATAFALSDAVLLRLDFASLGALIRSQPDFGYRLGEILARRILSSYRHLENLAIEDPKNRALDVLLWKMERRPEGNTVPLSPAECAKFSGLPKSVMDDVLADLSAAGRVKVYSDHIVVTDARFLARHVALKKGRKDDED